MSLAQKRRKNRREEEERARRRSVDQRRKIFRGSKRALFEGELKLEQDINGSQHVEEREEAVVHGWTEELFQQQHDDNEDNKEEEEKRHLRLNKGEKLPPKEEEDLLERETDRL